MDIRYLLICALILFITTLIPRLLGMLLSKFKIRSRFLRSFLYYMPYAVISALTFPAIFFSTGNVTTASIGTAVTIVLSLFIKKSFILVALACVAIVFALSFAF